MSAYLLDHPPVRSQFRSTRRAEPSGVVVVHTAENTPDTVATDGGAEAVARFIQRRSDPGSYHLLADSDSHIQMVPWSYEAFQDGTGSNPHAVGLSVATTAAWWPWAPKAWRDGAIEHLAQGAADYARWLHARSGIVIPARRITRAQSDLRIPGFISHGERDPDRRSDPGKDFPWGQFLARYAELTASLGNQETDDMAQHIVFYGDGAGGNHAYLVTNNIGKYLPTAEAIGLAEGFLEVSRANQPDKPLGEDWRSLAALLDGPLRNVG